MNEEKTCGPNYEAEYNRILREQHELSEKLAAMCEEIRILRNENNILRAQMDIVRLIFEKR